MAQEQAHWRIRYRPYLIAAALAMVTTMLVAPEINEGTAMEPAIKEGQVVVLTKGSFSAKRGAPDKGAVVVLSKLAAPEASEDNIIGRVEALPGETVTIDGKTVKLGDDEFYLLCDNESATVDSRTIGPVKLKDIRGVAKWKVWPLTDIGGIE